MAASLSITAARSLMQMATEVTCKAGVFDCANSLASSVQTCAAYDGQYTDIQNNYLMLTFTIIFAAAMAFAIGGNDGANAWATAVHSLAIKLRPAVLLAGIFEIIGATTLGYGVSGSIQKGISNIKDPNCFACGRCDSSMSLYYVGMMASLIGASSFLIGATYLRMPVSTTHAIVSAVLGMTVVYHGFGCVQWGMSNMGGIIVSWVLSPVMSGFICLFIYYVTYYFIFAAKSPRQRGFIALPALYFIVVFVISFLTFTKSPATKNVSKTVAAIVASSIGAVVSVLVIIFLLPYLRRNLPSIKPENKLDMEALMRHQDEPRKSVFSEVKTPTVEGCSSDATDPDLIEKVRESIAHVGMDDDKERASMQVIAEFEALTEEQQDAMWMFKFVLILVSCLQSFAHGSNDTANATAALAAVISGFNLGRDSCSDPASPWWIMFSAGVVLAIGVWLWGYRVMETIGRNICVVNFHRAFCTEFASSLTVVIASLLKLPVSSTHCQVGAVIFVSVAACGRKQVNWSLVTGVFSTWVATLPFAALVSALFAYLFKFAL